jgi:ribonuclease-3
MATPVEPLERLAERLGHRFRDLGLLARAVRHRSFCCEAEAAGPDNEALEFAGDAALELWVRYRLVARFPVSDPGRLSELADTLVNRDALAAVAAGLGLGDFLCLGRGTREQGGASHPTILADALEALFGAILLDGGYAAVEPVLERLIGPRLEGAALEDGRQVALRQVLEGVVHQRFGVAPRVEVAVLEGAPLEEVFEARVLVGERLWGSARGSAKKAARLLAVRAALEALEREP